MSITGRWARGGRCARSTSWTRGETAMTEARAAAGRANAAARDVAGRARHAVCADGQTVAVAHVAAHDRGVAAYAIKAVRAAASFSDDVDAGRRECEWQRDQLPETLRDLVLIDQRGRTTSAGWYTTAECTAPGKWMRGRRFGRPLMLR